MDHTIHAVGDRPRTLLHVYLRRAGRTARRTGGGGCLAVARHGEIERVPRRYVLRHPRSCDGSYRNGTRVTHAQPSGGAEALVDRILPLLVGLR